MTSPRTPNILVVQGRNYIVEQSLGEGAFGKVYKVREDGGSGSVYALKKIQVENQEAVEMVQKEINILTKCNHHHIVSLCGFSVSQISRSSFVLILMEYCEGGNLNSRLARSSGSETNHRWMTELADAISYLHSRNIAHRDLKPENVLLTGNDSIKLGDFGLAREYAVLKQRNATRSDQALMSYLNRVYMSTALGTPVWMAPEVFSGHYTESADIFALGAIFYVILTRTYVSSGKKKYYGAFVDVNGQKIGLGMAMLRNRNVMVPLDELSGSVRELIRGTLDYNPRNRPNGRQVLNCITSCFGDFSPPNKHSPKPVHAPDNIQAYRQALPRQYPMVPSPIPNFTSPSPSPNRQMPLLDHVPDAPQYRQVPVPNRFVPPHRPSPSPNFGSPSASPNRQMPLLDHVPDAPQYRQVPVPNRFVPPHRPSPSPTFGSPSPNIYSPQPIGRVGRIPNYASPNAHIRQLPPHRNTIPVNARPALMRTPAHIRVHTPIQNRPGRFVPSTRHTPHRFR